MSEQRETKRVRVAQAMRAAYGAYCGDEPVPWEESEAQNEWLVCADAAIQCLGVDDET